MTNDKTREDFEAWADSRQPRSLRSSVTGDYHYPMGNLALEVWTAATQQSAARIASLEAEVLALRQANDTFANNAIAKDAP